MRVDLKHIHRVAIGNNNVREAIFHYILMEHNIVTTFTKLQIHKQCFIGVGHSRYKVGQSWYQFNVQRVPYFNQHFHNTLHRNQLSIQCPNIKCCILHEDWITLPTCNLFSKSVLQVSAPQQGHAWAVYPIPRQKIRMKWHY